MPASFQQIINSKLFKFIVGEVVDGKPSEFFVYEDAIAQLSTPLRTLTKSSAAARSGCAIWRDVSKETFERFAQYAYTGDYSIPKTDKRTAVSPPKVNGVHPKIPHRLPRPDKAQNGATTQPSSPDDPNGVSGRVNSLGSEERSASEVRDGSVSEKMDEEGIILNYPVPSKKQHKKKKAARAAQEKAEKEARETELKGEQEVSSVQEPQQKETQPAEPEPVEIEPELEATPIAREEQPPEQLILTADFRSLTYPLIAPRDNYAGTCEPETVFEKDHSYSNIFLCHASIYVLGDVQLIEPLKALALFKLHKTLCVFELHNDNIGDITDLARYAYAGENNEVDTGLGGLRGLVCQYMAIHAVELSGDARFMHLLGGGGQFVKDFFKFQLQRIH